MIRRLESVTELKAAIRWAVEEINKDKELINRINLDFVVRLRGCAERSGAHLEPRLDEFKTRLRNMDPCGMRLQVHCCRCYICREACADIVQRLENEAKMSDSSSMSAIENKDEDEDFGEWDGYESRKCSQ